MLRRTMAAKQPLAEPHAPGDAAPPAAVAFHYTQSESFVELLQQLDVSLLVSTYQANKLLAVRASGAGLTTQTLQLVLCGTKFNVPVTSIATHQDQPIGSALVVPDARIGRSLLIRSAAGGI